MIPGWKIGREIRRLWVQLSEIFHRSTGWPRRLYYDRYMRPQSVITEGCQPLHEDVAILLIYQPKGLLPSLLHELDHFAAKGVSVVVVSNAPLAAEGRRQLVQRACLIIERPNFGYDFGGYRDGILTMLDRGVRPRNLFVLNDSMWFPIGRGIDLIERARSSASDIFGVFYNPKSRNPAHWHLHSYFYRFNGALVASQIFRNYWCTIPLYNAKGVVIRQFELKLTGWLRKRGFSIDALYAPESVIEATLELSDAALLEVIAFHMRGDEKKRAIFQRAASLHAKGVAWRPEAERAVRESRYRFYYLDADPTVLLDGLDSPILKKHTGENFREQRHELLARGLDQTLDPAVSDEVRAWDRARPPT